MPPTDNDEDLAHSGAFKQHERDPLRDPRYIVPRQLRVKRGVIIENATTGVRFMNPVDKTDGSHVINLSGTDNSQLSNVPFIFEMIVNLLETACNLIDPVLQNLGGFNELGTDNSGRPLGSDHFREMFSKLSEDNLFKYVGDSVTATTCLGMAYSHSIHLLSFLTSQSNQSRIKSPNPPKRIRTVDEYSKLDGTLRQELNKIFMQTELHDFELCISAGNLDMDDKLQIRPDKDKFRQQLVYWDEYRLLQDSHMLFSHPRGKTVYFMIPLRSILVLDRMIAEHIAPRLEFDYRTMDSQLSKRTKEPEIKWDGTKVEVSLPNKLNRVLEARWIPTVTSVVRIREYGTNEWSPGFETIFNYGSFIDLKPDTEYEMQVTQKNEVGEGKPNVIRMKTDPED